MTSNIPTQAEYEAREDRALAKQLQEVETAPLAERQAARAEWRKALADPDLIAERCEWVLMGNYGFGAARQAAIIQSRKNGNRVAALSLLVAAVEWQCPRAFAASAFNQIPQWNKEALIDAIQNVLANTELAAPVKE